MPKRQYSLVEGGPKRLLLEWGLGFRNLTATLDGAQVLKFESLDHLKLGRKADLASGDTLEIKLERKPFSTELGVWWNGAPVPGTSADPETQLSAAYGIIYLVAALSVIVGLLAEFLTSSLRESGFGWPTIGFGLVFAALGFWVQKRRSKVGLAIAVALFALDGLLSAMYGSGTVGQGPNLTPLIVRFFLLLPMIRGFGAIHLLETEHEVR